MFGFRIHSKARALFLTTFFGRRRDRLLGGKGSWWCPTKLMGAHWRVGLFLAYGVDQQMPRLKTEK